MPEEKEELNRRIPLENISVDIAEKPKSFTWTKAFTIQCARADILCYDWMKIPVSQV